MVTIRPLSPIDIDSAEVLLKRAFLRPANRRIELERALRIQPDGWHLAEIDGVQVGMVGAVVYDRFSWIGLMAVDPDHQSRGIGRALMKHVLADLDRRKALDSSNGGNEAMVLLDASEAGAPLYQSLGFIEEDECRVYNLSLPLPLLSSDVQTKLEQGKYRITPMTSKLLSAIAAFDAPLFGASREAVLKAYFDEFSDRSFVVLSPSGQIEGYLIAQAMRIGPWTASSNEVAEILFHRALRLNYNDPPHVIIPGKNSAAASLISALGFTPGNANKHMRRGGTGLTGFRERIFGQASFAVG
ncbi:MAG: GNAT family N-acetyltransferase [Candidatus Ozemobacteraceae bacterium]